MTSPTDTVKMVYVYCKPMKTKPYTEWIFHTENPADTDAAYKLLGLSSLGESPWVEIKLLNKPDWP